MEGDRVPRLENGVGLGGRGGRGLLLVMIRLTLFFGTGGILTEVL